MTSTAPASGSPGACGSSGRRPSTALPHEPIRGDSEAASPRPLGVSVVVSRAECSGRAESGDACSIRPSRELLDKLSALVGRDGWYLVYGSRSESRGEEARHGNEFSGIRTTHRGTRGENRGTQVPGFGLELSTSRKKSSDCKRRAGRSPTASSRTCRPGKSPSSRVIRSGPTRSTTSP